MEVSFGNHRVIDNEILNIVQSGQEIKIKVNNAIAIRSDIESLNRDDRQAFYNLLHGDKTNFYQKFPNPASIGKLVAKINFRVKASGINGYPELYNLYGDLQRYIINNLGIYQIFDICFAE